MSKPLPRQPTSVPPDAYTREYYESCCEGYEEFNATQGDHLPRRLSIPLLMAGVKPGMKVLDLGCGRGEIVLHCARLGAQSWGLDYAIGALNIATGFLADERYQEYNDRMAFQQSRSDRLPFADHSFDRVFMLDIVEHLLPAELEETFGEVGRVLCPNGKLIIHTMPNLWYYRYGYPVYRFIQALRGQKLPENPRLRWEYSHVHVNEQTPPKLRQALTKAQFHSKIWLHSTQSYAYEPNPVVRFGMGFLTTIYPFRWIFCNDIFAIGTK